MQDAILSDAELDALSAPLSVPTPFASWCESERVARAFAEGIETDAILSDADRLLCRLRRAETIRRAVRARIVGQRAAGVVSDSARLARVLSAFGARADR